MRVSEVCILKIGFLRKDENGHYIVFYMKKEVSNPIPENLYYKIFNYQKTIKEKFGNEQIYLFPKSDGLLILANTYKDKMQLITKKFHIRNYDGSIYIFRAHEYRTTFTFCKYDIENFKEYMNRLDDNIQYSKANGFERMKEANEK